MLSRLSRSIRTSLLRLEKKRLTSKILAKECEVLTRGLIEADVSVGAAKEFSRRVSGDFSSGSGDGAGIFSHRLTELLTGSKAAPRLKGKIFIVGLNGAGKTTTSCKIAKKLREEEGSRVCLVAGDLSRPAAVEQLRTLGEKAGVDVHCESSGGMKALAAEGAAKIGEYDTVIFDLAGRQDTDGGLLGELEDMSRIAEPDVVLCVCDGAGGQQMAEVGKAFAQRIRVDGIVLTKMDGDACGGGVISVIEATGAPVILQGTGEGLDDLSEFCPESTARRILGKGDASVLIDKLGDTECRLEETLGKGKMDMNGFLAALRMIRGLGPLAGIAEAAGFFGEGPGQEGGAESECFSKIEAIIFSMSAEERRVPELLDEEGRVVRIAGGAGVTEGEVREVMGRFFRMRELL